MLFADSVLARRIEHAETRLTTDVAAIVDKRAPRSVFVAALAGGAAVHLGYDAPFNKLIGLGLKGPLTPDDEAALAAIEREFARRLTPLQAEVCTLADSSVVRLLSRRGYALLGFENVLGMQLGSAAGLEAEERPPLGATTTHVAAAEFDPWMETVLSGFSHPDAVPVGESHESFPRAALEKAMADLARASGFTRYLTRIDGEMVGGAGLRICEGVAQLCGSATLPAYRRRGVQTALLRHRIRDARRSGCDVAVITTQPGSKSQQNAQRRGFALLYARAILVRVPT